MKLGIDDINLTNDILTYVSIQDIKGAIQNDMYLQELKAYTSEG